MTKEAIRPHRISIWVRALAWVMTLTGVPAAGAYLYALIAGSHKWSRPQAAIYLVVLVWMLPVFAFSAVRGTAPRRWPGFAIWRWSTSDPSVDVGSVGKE
jgi:hypothetical protein